MEFPHYSYPLQLAPGLIASLLLNRRRSFRKDALACLACLNPGLQVLGCEHIPAAGPGVLVVNHYHRPGFGAWWIALAVAANLPVEAHWVMTAELTFAGRWHAFASRPVSRWLLRRAAHCYGFTTMPPMPPRPHEVEERARSVRGVLEELQHHPDCLLAVSPEGRDAPGGVLAPPPPGAGRFLQLVSRHGFPIHPVGCWEQDGHLCLRFGPAFTLQLPGGLTPQERDRMASDIMMSRLAQLLPDTLRGFYASGATPMD
jgi:hypothetical protein